MKQGIRRSFVVYKENKFDSPLRVRVYHSNLIILCNDYQEQKSEMMKQEVRRIPVVYKEIFHGWKSYSGLTRV